MKHPRIARRPLLVTLILLLPLSACILATPAPATAEIPETGPTALPLGDWLEIYFTDPDAAKASDYEDGVDEAIAASIDGALLSVDVAVYNLNLWSIRDAILAAHERGVVVRMVVDSDHLDSEEIQQLMNAGIQVLGDRQESLMHNKFVVIDRYEVWTGSMNFTLNGVYEDNNNMLHFFSREIAEDYLVEFEEMFVDDLFGPFTQALTPNPMVFVVDTLVEVLFSPDDGVQARLVDLINSAQESIYFLAYSFTSDPLGDALLSRSTAGMTVAGVMEADQVTTNIGSEYDRFMQAGINVLLDGNDDLMHDKVIIIDQEIVITGSYNFSASAEQRNDENVVILHNPNVASAYLVEFWKIYNRALP
jgi:phosphatidylserine/phosphatidylglycerophosphate/cardiolipin synthase-like enzyme